MKKLDDATLRQIEAAAPSGSSWISANAGSGKTKVLTDRVARLLLSGTPSQNILCLTFTKAAAANMQNSLYARLGDWSMLPEVELREKLTELGEGPDSITSEKLNRARTLFAQALETPGGLKIQTIHAFSASLIGQFAVEAGVSPGFQTLDETDAAQLVEEVKDEVAQSRTELFDEMAANAIASGKSVEAIVRTIVAKREQFKVDIDEEELWRAFGISPGTTPRDLSRTFLSVRNHALILSMIEAFEEVPTKTNQTFIARLEEAIGNDDPFASLTALSAVFHTTTGRRRKIFPPKKVAGILGPRRCAEIERLYDEFVDFRTAMSSLMDVSPSLTLLRFSTVILDAYEKAKERQARLDFDDLIFKTLSLLADSSSTDWVRYRLDGRIDHILVDEAQDVNPDQWRIVSQLAREFTDGHSARPDVNRTVFAVGDEKQSIYGFQGARPEKFAEMHDVFKRRHKHARKKFGRHELNYSFRSASIILELVDRVFENRAHMVGSGAWIRHRAFKPNQPGRVDLWPFLHRTTRSPSDEANWCDAVDVPREPTPQSQLAAALANYIQFVVEEEEVYLPSANGVRPATYGDFLLLVQTRSTMFNEIQSKLRERNLPFAGADRMDYVKEIVVKDLTAVLRFLATPADCLSLAAVLKSPLFGLTEQDLYTVAVSRDEGTTLWEALRDCRHRFAAVTESIEDLLGRVGRESPYALLERILTVNGARQRLVHRLGKQVEDVIDTLLYKALEFERTEPGTLTSFLDWLDIGKQDVKRELEQAGDQIRVMTVHGAKGLESPIVILPDTAQRYVQTRVPFLFSEEGLPLLLTGAGGLTSGVAAKALEIHRERERCERMRLLYVAMTRAKNWLIVAGAGRFKHDDGCWHSIVEDAMLTASDSSSVKQVFSEVQEIELKTMESVSPYPGLRIESGHWPESRQALAKPADPVESAESIALPRWLSQSAPDSPEQPALLSPSGLGGYEAGEDADAVSFDHDPLARGSIVHKFLEDLPDVPKADRMRVAKSLARKISPDASPDEIAICYGQYQKVAASPDLRNLFGPNALSEVAIAARPGEIGNRQLYGIIDRLVVEPDRVLAVDFKSNRVVPRCPEDIHEPILRQMGAYLAALEEIYPERKVETAIVWTETAQYMKVDSTQARAALKRGVRGCLTDRQSVSHPGLCERPDPDEHSAPLL